MSFSLSSHRHSYLSLLFSSRYRFIININFIPPDASGHLNYPNDIDRSLNETVTDKIRKYWVDYNNNPPNTISFKPVILSTSGRLHSDFVILLFLHVHRETERFLPVSGVQLSQSNSVQFHYHHVVFSSHLKSKCGNILAKSTVLRIILNIDSVGEACRYFSFSF